MKEIQTNYFAVTSEEAEKLIAQGLWHTTDLMKAIRKYGLMKKKELNVAEKNFHFKYGDYPDIFKRGLKIYILKRQSKKGGSIYILDDSELLKAPGGDYMRLTRGFRIWADEKQINYDLALKHYDENIELWRTTSQNKLLQKLKKDLQINFTKRNLRVLVDKFNLEHFAATGVRNDKKYGAYRKVKKNKNIKIEEKLGGIYSINSGDDGSVLYIGSSVDFIKRWQLHNSHLKSNKHSNKKLQKIYNENPNIEFKILKIIDNPDPLKLGIAEAICTCNYKPICNDVFVMTNSGHQTYFNLTDLDMGMLDLIN